MRVAVLPVMMDPEFLVPFFLVGRSRPVDSWMEGSLLWSDFGGQVGDGETTEDAAARELVEETAGVLVSPTDVRLFAQALRDSMFVVRIQTEDSLTFVVRFAWRPSLPFEFGTVHRHLKALGRVSRGVPLSAAERLLLCRFRWLQSHADPALQRWIQHPALRVRRQILPASAIQAASDSLSSALQASRRSVDVHAPSSCIVIDGVRSSWIEKDQMELFTLQQLQAALKPPGLTCSHGQTMEFAPSFLATLRVLVKAIMTGQFSCH
jgi:8-oxo-dGTP pyrophosphatase MutT (NUDIX family)